MASWTLCTSGAAVVKAGTHANSTIAASGSALQGFADAAEGKIEASTRKSYIDNYSSLSIGVKNMLSDVASSIVAMDIIAYDNTGYLAREADMLMNKLDERINSGLAILKDFKTNALQSPL